MIGSFLQEIIQMQNHASTARQHGIEQKRRAIIKSIYFIDDATVQEIYKLIKPQLPEGKNYERKQSHSHR